MSEYSLQPHLHTILAPAVESCIQVLPQTNTESQLEAQRRRKIISADIDFRTTPGLLRARDLHRYGKEGQSITTGAVARLQAGTWNFHGSSKIETATPTKGSYSLIPGRIRCFWLHSLENIVRNSRKTRLPLQPDRGNQPAVPIKCWPGHLEGPNFNDFRTVG